MIEKCTLQSLAIGGLAVPANNSMERDMEMLKVLTKTAREWSRARDFAMAEATFNRAAPYIPRIECLAESMDSEAEEHKAHPRFPFSSGQSYTSDKTQMHPLMGTSARKLGLNPKSF